MGPTGDTALLFTWQQELLDTATDVYKLGLAILRWLIPGKGAATARAADRLAGQLDPEAIALVVSALSDARTSRPTARDLYDHFLQLISPTDRAALPRLRPRAKSRHHCQDFAATLPAQET